LCCNGRDHEKQGRDRRSPDHPALVPLPIGCFFLALVSDVLHALTRNAFWYDVSAFAIGVGIATALAAVFGASTSSPSR